MKKSLIIVMCLTALMGFAFAEENTGRDETVQILSETQIAERLNLEKTKTFIIQAPEGFGGFEDRNYMTDEMIKAGGNIRIEYSQVYDEIHIYYTCMMVHYDRGSAMNACLAVLQDFQLVEDFKTVDGETYKKDRYYHYKYLVPDKEKYFKNDRGFGMAQYHSYIKFSR